MGHSFTYLILPVGGKNELHIFLLFAWEAYDLGLDRAGLKPVQVKYMLLWGPNIQAWTQLTSLRISPRPSAFSFW